MEIKSRVFFADEKLRQEFESLEKGKHEEKEIYGWIAKALDEIKQNAFTGIQVPKRIIPEPYIEKYKITNLWKYDLPRGWRLLYSVGKEGIEVISIVLEWMDHKEYERRFRY
jgi:Txe/YoeB family toxin of Txe-Axe toxin-antitoxin module